jgi:type VI secretion system protein ImpJ
MRANQLKVHTIQWYEGMLLGPQHFQQFKLQMDCENRRLLALSSPYFWGVSHLKLDTLHLTSGKLRVLELEAIFPDGLMVSVDPTTPLNLEIDVARDVDLFRQKGPQILHLAIPAYVNNGSNLTGDFPRYLSKGGEFIVDINTGENPVEVPQLIPNLSLILGEVPHPRYVSFPLAEIVFRDEAYQLTSFLPPHVSVSTTSLLGVVMGDILERLRNKSAFLSENLQSSQSSVTVDHATLAHYDVLLKAITRDMPFLENLLRVGITHPYRLYEGLLMLAGNLANLRQGQIAPTFSPYDHDNIYATFDQVVSFIVRMIDRIQENYEAITFSQSERVFATVLEPRWVSDRFVISLKGTPIFGPKDLIAWAEDAIIASESLIKSTRDRRILGAGRRYLDNAPELNISAPQEGILLSIENDPNFIVPGEALCLLNLSDRANARPKEIILYVRKDHSSPPRNGNHEA